MAKRTLFSVLFSRTRAKSWKQTIATATPACALLMLGLYGCAGSGGTSPLYPLSINRMKALDLSVLEYANDYDEVLPLADSWMDSTTPYSKDPTVYHSPSVGNRGYGYALNQLVAGLSPVSFPYPFTTIDLFDSTDISRNASAATTTLPRPPRYGRYNTIGYLDGHVQNELSVVTKAELYSQSQSNLKSVNLGMLMYANDYDGVLPLNNTYVDALTPYVKNQSLFRSPAVELKNPNAYGYAFSIDLVGINSMNLSSPATTISFFDSTVLTKNATQSTTTLPNPPRYGNSNTIAYSDGHVAK